MPNGPSRSVSLFDTNEIRLPYPRCTVYKSAAGVEFNFDQSLYDLKNISVSSPAELCNALQPRRQGHKLRFVISDTQWRIREIVNKANEIKEAMLTDVPLASSPRSIMRPFF